MSKAPSASGATDVLDPWTSLENADMRGSTENPTPPPQVEESSALFSDDESTPVAAKVGEERGATFPTLRLESDVDQNTAEEEDVFERPRKQRKPRQLGKKKKKEAQVDHLTEVDPTVNSKELDAWSELFLATEKKQTVKETRKKKSLPKPGKKSTLQQNDIGLDTSCSSHCGEEIRQDTENTQGKANTLSQAGNPEHNTDTIRNVTDALTDDEQAADEDNESEYEQELSCNSSESDRDVESEEDIEAPRANAWKDLVFEVVAAKQGRRGGQRDKSKQDPPNNPNEESLKDGSAEYPSQLHSVSGGPTTPTTNQAHSSTCSAKDDDDQPLFSGDLLSEDQPEFNGGDPGVSENEDNSEVDLDDLMAEWTAEDHALYSKQKQARLEALAESQKRRRQRLLEKKKLMDKRLLLTTLRFLCPHAASWTERNSLADDDDEAGGTGHPGNPEGGMVHGKAFLVPVVNIPLACQRDPLRPNRAATLEAQQKAATELRANWAHSLHASRKWCLSEGLLVEERKPASSRDRLLLAVEKEWISDQRTLESRVWLNRAEAQKRLFEAFPDAMKTLQALTDPTDDYFAQLEPVMARLPTLQRWQDKVKVVVAKKNGSKRVRTAASQKASSKQLSLSSAPLLPQKKSSVPLTRIDKNPVESNSNERVLDAASEPVDEDSESGHTPGMPAPSSAIPTDSSSSIQVEQLKKPHGQTVPLEEESVSVSAAETSDDLITFSSEPAFRIDQSLNNHSSPNAKTSNREERHICRHQHEQVAIQETLDGAADRVDTPHGAVVQPVDLTIPSSKNEHLQDPTHGSNDLLEPLVSDVEKSTVLHALSTKSSLSSPQDGDVLLQHGFFPSSPQGVRDNFPSLTSLQKKRDVRTPQRQIENAYVDDAALEAESDTDNDDTENVNPLDKRKRSQHANASDDEEEVDEEVAQEFLSELIDDSGDTLEATAEQSANVATLFREQTEADATKRFKQLFTMEGVEELRRRRAAKGLASNGENGSDLTRRQQLRALALEQQAETEFREEIALEAYAEELRWKKLRRKRGLLGVLAAGYSSPSSVSDSNATDNSDYDETASEISEEESPSRSKDKSFFFGAMNKNTFTTTTKSNWKGFLSHPSNTSKRRRRTELCFNERKRLSSEKPCAPSSHHKLPQNESVASTLPYSHPAFKFAAKKWLRQESHFSETPGKTHPWSEKGGSEEIDGRPYHGSALLCAEGAAMTTGLTSRQERAQECGAESSGTTKKNIVSIFLGRAVTPGASSSSSAGCAEKGTPLTLLSHSLRLNEQYPLAGRPQALSSRSTHQKAAVGSTVASSGPVKQLQQKRGFMERVRACVAEKSQVVS